MFKRIFLLALWMSSLPAQAFDWHECLTVTGFKPFHWPIGTGGAIYAPWLDSITLPTGSPQRSSLVNAMQQLSQIPSQMRFKVRGETAGAGDPDRSDGKSQIWFANMGSDGHAVTKRYRKQSNLLDCVYKEVDIIFNDSIRTSGGYQFNTGKTPLAVYGGNKASFRSIALHELGHAAGAQHEEQTPNLMGLVHGGPRPAGPNTAFHVPGARVGSTKVAASLIGSDFANGIKTIYGTQAGKPNDISVSPWKLGGSEDDGYGDPYSLHRRRDLLTTPLGVGYPLVDNPDDPDYLRTDPVYLVLRGNWISLKFIYENSGSTEVVTAPVSVYLSTDDAFDISDRLLDNSTTLTILASVGPSIQGVSFLLPRDIATPQKYYLFAVLDPGNTLLEATKTNNATYAVVQVNN